MARQKKIRFPVAEPGVRRYPAGLNCPVCGSKLFDRDFQVILGVGALRRIGKDEWDGMGNDDLGGMMYLVTHSHDGRHAGVDIVDRAGGGQCDLVFCSFGCVRKFLDMAVDEIEAMWKKSKAKVGQKGEGLQ